MPEIKSQYNVRINNDMNISLSFSHIVNDADDAKEAGLSDSAMIKAYVYGISDKDE